VAKKKKKSGGSPVHNEMTRWYSPKQMSRAVGDILISTLLGTRADVRLTEIMTGGARYIDYNKCYSDEHEFWFDYMGDTGDGWDSTFAMAKLTSAPERKLQHEGVSHTLKRGAFLVLGGDEVYPSASREAYQTKLVAPFEEAAKQPELTGKCALGHLFAIPGNHDWYDGLISFMRQFQQGRNIGIYKTIQTRSYFALKLPRNWWLWGVDTQLESDIDWPQVEYFRGIAEKMKDKDRLIVCTAEPHWYYEVIEKGYADNNLNFLLSEKVLRDKRITLHLSLSGDLHHYRRHEASDDSNRQKIISGGGGAFLHPTHSDRAPEFCLEETEPMAKPAPKSDYYVMVKSDNPDGVKDPGNDCKPHPVMAKTPTVQRRYCKKAEYPSEEVSRKLAIDVPFFYRNNLSFGWVTALLYLILGAIMVWSCFWAWLAGGLTLLITYRVCDDLNGKACRVVWGGLHGLVHLGAVGLLVVFGKLFLGFLGESVGLYGTLFAGGFIIGPLIFGLYLFASLEFLQLHHNEAFGSLRIADYKNFIRLRIDSDGVLTVFPVGLETTEGKPFLIEKPIVIDPRAKYHQPAEPTAETGKCPDFRINK
jgi:hypothetical protein